jgi:hypothetical protein
MNDLAQQTSDKDLASGYVYIMTHSFFHDVVRIGCTPEEPNLYTEKLSAKTPGDYTLVFSLKCDNPCQIKKKIKTFLKAQSYVNEFYQVPPDLAKRILKRETLRIPALNSL